MGYVVRGAGKKNRETPSNSVWLKKVMRFCPVPSLRNEDARHVLRDGTVLQLFFSSQASEIKMDNIS
jgi:hypothetical protein